MPGDVADLDLLGALGKVNTVHLLAAEVTWPWFRTFGAQPILGRTFGPDDDQKGAARTVVLSYGAWQRLFGGQHDAVGKSLVLDGQSYRVIGVMRSDFDWPRSDEVWVPLGLAPTAYSADQRYNEFYSSVVRLRPGISVAQFNAAIDQKHREQVRREGSGSFGAVAGDSGDEEDQRHERLGFSFDHAERSYREFPFQKAASGGAGGFRSPAH